MNNRFEHQLSELENKHNIKILLACETGSRAWGFPSLDSDFDVRLIYVHKKDWYLSLTEEKDTIELMLNNNEIDISGWDLRKSLRLLKKSNPPLLERIQSSVIYKVENQFLSEIKLLAQEFYSPIASVHHYLSMGKKSLDVIDYNERYKLKKFFYALRSSIVCLWILERNEIPPIEIKKLIEGLEIPDDIKQRIDYLIDFKSGTTETYLHHGEKQIFNFMNSCLNRAENEAAKLAPSNGEIEKLNILFRHTLRNYDY